MKTENLRIEGKLGDHYIANSLLIGISLKEFSRKVSYEIGKEKLVHYAHESVPPLSKCLDHTVITVHENPFARLNTDLYNRVSNT